MSTRKTKSQKKNLRNLPLKPTTKNQKNLLSKNLPSKKNQKTKTTTWSPQCSKSRA